MRKKKPLFGALAVVAAAALALSGCGRQESQSSDSASNGGFAADAKIGVSLPQKTSENWVLAENLFKTDLKDAGFDADVQFANGGASEQQNQISSMITNGVKVLVVGAVDGGQLSAQVQEAKDKGITVIAYDRILTNTKNVDYYIAYNNYQVGVLQGEALVKGLEERKGKKDSYNVELIAGSPDDANSKPFFEGAMSVLKPKIDSGELKVLSKQTSFDQVATQGWLPANVQKRMDAILSANYGSESLDGILSPNDTLARAALLSAKSAGQKTPVITGQDSEVESVKSIMAGEQYSTINKDTTALVNKTVETVKQLQKGEPVEAPENTNNGVKDVPTIYLKPQLVTKENAPEAYKNDKTLSEIAKG